MTTQQARNLYNRGYILQNWQNVIYQPTIFQLCGLHFTSNKKRAHKGKHYKIDNKYWKVFINNSLLTKLHLIVTRRVTLISRRP